MKAGLQGIRERLLRPRSMVVLVVAGFALVAGPLLIAIAGGAVYVDRLAERSERLVRQSVATARDSEALTSQLLSMERTARQYAIVGGDELREVYAMRQAELLQLVDDLEAHGIPDPALETAKELRTTSTEVAAVFATAESVDSHELRTAIERFAGMRYLAARISQSIEMAIDRELAGLEQESRRARQFLFWQSAALVPITVLIGGVFAWLILQPIRRLARAIRSLGSVAPPGPIEVGGPPEIRALGVELERLRMRLERSEAEKNRFMRHMSHELKTPLAAIREGTELLADGSIRPDTEAHREIVDILRASSIELLQLIENLLVLSARDLSRLTETIELEPLVEEVLGRHRLALQRAGLRVERHIGPETFDGFRPLIHAALSNLVGNAIRYSPPGGTLYIDITRRRGWVMIDVADEGPGIPQEEQPYVFEPFYQGQASAAGSGRGTGVGLSVVRDCARAHEGSVEVIDGEYPGAHIRLNMRARGRVWGGFG